jgi:hypothetical protein
VHADFLAVDDTDVLVILRLHLSELGIAFFTVFFSIFVVVHFVYPFNEYSVIIIFCCGFFILQTKKTPSGVFSRAATKAPFRRNITIVAVGANLRVRPCYYFFP